MTDEIKTFGDHNSAVLAAYRSLREEACKYRFDGNSERANELYAQSELLFGAKEYMYDQAVLATPQCV